MVPGIVVEHIVFVFEVPLTKTNGESFPILESSGGLVTFVMGSEAESTSGVDSTNSAIFGFGTVGCDELKKKNLYIYIYI